MRLLGIACFLALIACGGPSTRGELTNDGDTHDGAGGGDGDAGDGSGDGDGDGAGDQLGDSPGDDDGDGDEGAQLTLSYCHTETAAAWAFTGRPSPELTGVVYAAGFTEGDGAAAGLQAELVYGAAGSDPLSWTSSVAATFKEPADGVSEGDKANDRFRAQLDTTSAGELDYAFRFSGDGGLSWSYCDTDGSSGAPVEFETDKVGRFTVESPTPDWCNVQFPQVVATAPTGDNITFYGRVAKAGITDVSDGDPLIAAQLLVGPLGFDPLTASTSTYETLDATLNAGVSGAAHEEYQATWEVSDAGERSAFFRFSLDGGSSWQLCDIDGAGDEASFASDAAATLAAHASPPNLVDYCRVWQSEWQVSSSDAAPIVTVEVYEAGITEGGGSDHEQLLVEVGYGRVGANPAVPAAFTWAGATLPYARVGPQATNNYEYEGAIYGVAPASGTYAIVTRARRADTGAWVYCDLAPESMDFDQTRTARLTVTP